MKGGILKSYFRNLVSKILNRQFLKFLFFVALSTCFWLFQHLSSYYEMEFEVPVKLVNVPEKAIVTTPPQASLRVVLKDHGSTLLQYRYFMDFSPINIDFTQYEGRNGHVSILTRELMKQLSRQYFNYGAHKRLPVRFLGRVGTESQMRISGVSVIPDSVSVYAIESVLDTMTAAYTTAFELSALKRDTDFMVPIHGVRGAKFVPSQVRTKVYVDMITEKTVQVPVEMVNFPATKVLRTFPPKVNVTFQIGASKYNTVNAGNFVIVVSYDELVNNVSGKFSPRLKTLPAGVSHARISPGEVEFVIEDIPSSDGQ